MSSRLQFSPNLARGVQVDISFSIGSVSIVAADTGSEPASQGNTDSSEPVQIANADEEETERARKKKKELKSARSAVKSFRERVREHEEKLERYIRDPDSEDHEGKLKDPEYRDRRIRGRIRVLQRAITRHEGFLRKAEERLRRLEAGD
jgi:molecular chaperone DnaK (HSP70)